MTNHNELVVQLAKSVSPPSGSSPPTPQAQSSVSRSDNPPKPMTEIEIWEKKLAEAKKKAKLASLMKETEELLLETAKDEKEAREKRKLRLEVEAENEREVKKAAEPTVDMDPINDLQCQPSVPIPQLPLPLVRAPVPPEQLPQAAQHPHFQDLHLAADQRGQQSNEESAMAQPQPESQPATDQFEPDQQDNHQPETEPAVDPLDHWSEQENLEDQPGPAPRAVEYTGFVNDIGRPKIRNYEEIGTRAVAPESINIEEMEVVMNEVEEPEAAMEQDPLDVIRNHELRGNRIARGGGVIRTQFGIMRRVFKNRDGTASGPGRGSRGKVGISIEAQEAVSSGARGAPRARGAPKAPRAPRGRRGAPSIRAEGADNAPMIQEEAEKVEDLQQVVVQMVPAEDQQEVVEDQSSRSASSSKSKPQARGAAKKKASGSKTASSSTAKAKNRKTAAQPRLTAAQWKKITEEAEAKKKAKAEEKRRLANLQRDARNPAFLPFYDIAKKDFTNSKD